MKKFISKKMLTEKETLEHFGKNLIESLSFVESQDADYVKAIAIASHYLMEFGLYHTGGDIPLVSSIFAETLTASALRRVNMEEYAPRNRILINSVGVSLENRGNPAATLLLIHVLKLLEEFAVDSHSMKNLH